MRKQNHTLDLIFSIVDDFSFRFLSFLITLTLSLTLLRSIHNELKLKESLQETYNKQTDFLAHISHRLKTPLAVCKNNLSIAKLSFKDKDFSYLEESLLKADLSVDKVSRMCTNLITLGKIDFGISTLNKENLDLSNLIEEAVGDFAPLTENRHLETKIEKDIQFFGDPVRLREMILNLLDNAVKFTDPDKGKISVNLEKSSSQIELIVSDNGIGIKPDERDHLFQRYYQSKSKSGSAGIGLAIVKWVVEEHGGKITVESQVRKFTKFTIIFPISQM